MIRALWLFWALREHHSRVRPWIDELMGVADTFSPASQVDLLWTAMVLADNVGDDDGALAAYRGLTPLMEQIDDPYMRAMSNLAAAWTAPIAGEIDGVNAMEHALQKAWTSLDMFRGQDEPFWTTLVLTALASIETTTGRYDDAQAHLVEACDRTRVFDYTWLASWAKSELGVLRVLRGEIDKAAEVLDEALSLSKRSHNIRSMTLGMSGFIWLAAAEGDLEQAALLTGAIDGLRQRIGIQLWPILRSRRQERVAKARAALGDERYDEVYAAGTTLSYQEAVAAVEAQQAARRAAGDLRSARVAADGDAVFRDV
jgi:non-specific serine/threonine protein kinase